MTATEKGNVGSSQAQVAGLVAETKKGNGFLTEAEAAEVFAANPPEIGGLVRKPSTRPSTYKAADILLSPRMWPTLARVLRLDGQPDNVELDFDIVAKYFNDLIQKAGNATPKPRKLSGKELRKVLMTATRNVYGECAKALAKAKALRDFEPDKQKATDAAKAKLDEVKAILARQGWKAKPTERKVKKKVASGKAGEAGNMATGSCIAAEAKSVPARPSLEFQASGDSGDSTPTDGMSEEEKLRPFTGEGFGNRIKTELDKLGGKYDKTIKKWRFPTAKAKDLGEKMMAEDAAKEKAKNQAAK